MVARTTLATVLLASTCCFMTSVVAARATRAAFVGSLLSTTHRHRTRPYQHFTLVSSSSLPLSNGNDDSSDNKVEPRDGSNVDPDISMNEVSSPTFSTKKPQKRRRVAIIGAGWGGLSAAHALSKQDENIDVLLIEASPKVGGLVRDGYTTISGQRPAEAGQHGFWQNYHNIYRLLRSKDDIVGFNINTALTDFAEQGQYSPNGLQAVWPVYRDQPVTLPTGLAQAAYTRFVNLPLLDLLSAWPLVLAFADFDDSESAWQLYDGISFYDLCRQLGVSRRCYDEAFEPMILTGLFAPGAECSAAAALGMAYFFVLQRQEAFDVQWCRGNIGNVIFDPWTATLQKRGVSIQCHARVTNFTLANGSNLPANAQRQTRLCQNQKRIVSLTCTDTKTGTQRVEAVDDVIMAVGAKALNAFVRSCPELAQFAEFQRFANLRGTSVLATRLFFDRTVNSMPYTANACWGFDTGIGMTVFDIGALHGKSNSSTMANCTGSVIEVDYYHAASLLVQSDEAILAKVQADLAQIVPDFGTATIVDAAIVRLPDAVNWYFPGSYQYMPNLQSQSVSNLYYCGDIVKTRHGSWSQEKAFVTGVQAVNLLLGRHVNDGVQPMSSDEIHVQFGRSLFSSFRKAVAAVSQSSREHK